MLKFTAKGLTMALSKGGLTSLLSARLELMPGMGPEQIPTFEKKRVGQLPIEFVHAINADQQKHSEGQQILID